MSQHLFPGEKDRAKVVGPIIRKLGRPTAYRAIVEYKNEMGIGGCDAVAQGIKGYEKLWAAQEVRHIARRLLIRCLNNRLDQSSACILLLSELHCRHCWTMDVYSRGGTHR